MMAKNWSLLLPLFITGCIILMLFKALDHDPFKRKSALLNNKAPEFQVQSLVNEQSFTHTVFEDHITLVHFFASWCGYCQQEYSSLAKIAGASDIQWVGINFRDKMEPAKRLIQKGSNPYAYTGFDPAGKIAIDFGVTGAPESFIIDAHQMIRFHFQGPITLGAWQNEFLPAIQAIRAQ